MLIFKVFKVFWVTTRIGLHVLMLKTHGFSYIVSVQNALL